VNITTVNTSKSKIHLLHVGFFVAYGQYANSQPVAQPPSDPGTDQYIEMLRKDVRSLRKQIVAANLDLTVDGQNFWLIYDEYTGWQQRSVPEGAHILAQHLMY